MGKSEMPKGLEALFSVGAAGPPEYATLPPELLEPNPYQPRQTVADSDIDNLAASIKREGLLQPIVATRRGEKNIIVAGERRWQAARKAGLSLVPVVFRQVDEPRLLVCALIENLQRRNLSPIEEAEAFERLRNEFSLPVGRIAEVVGKSSAHISNALRLLDLPSSVQNLIHQGSISPGHGKVLLTLNEPTLAENFALKVIREGLSVRALESAIKQVVVPVGRARPRLKSSDPVRQLAQEMSEDLGRRVWIQVYGSGNNQHGRIVLEFHSSEDFAFLRERLLQHLAIGDKK